MGDRPEPSHIWRCVATFVALSRSARLWLVVLLGAAVGLSASFFFQVEDVKLHTTLVLLLVTFVACVIFVVLAMDRPFRGDLGITSEPYELIYNHLMTR